MQLIILFFVKVIDNLIMTLKSLLQFRNKKILSSILVIISQLLFYLIIKQVIADNTTLTIVVVSIASGIGNLIAFPVLDKFSQDDVWQNTITSNDKEFLINLCNMLREHKVKYLIFNTLNRRFEESYTIEAYTKTKAESKLIDEFLAENENVKYLRMVDGIEQKKIIKEESEKNK